MNLSKGSILLGGWGRGGAAPEMGGKQEAESGGVSLSFSVHCMLLPLLHC